MPLIKLNSSPQCIIAIWTMGCIFWVFGQSTTDYAPTQSSPSYPTAHSFPPPPVLNLSHLSIPKCVCHSHQVYDLFTGNCSNNLTNVTVADPISREVITANTSDFGSTNVAIPTCSQGEDLVSLSVNSFYVLTTGELFSFGTDSTHPLGTYCVEHIAYNPGEVYLKASICLAQFPIPHCCCPSKTQLNGESDSGLSLPIPVYGLNVPWEYNSTANLTCRKHQIKKQVLVGLDGQDEAILQYNPTGAVLIVPGIPSPFGSEEFCLSQNEHEDSAPRYIADFCYTNPEAQHRKQCEEAICVRKCCPLGYSYYMPSQNCIPMNSSTSWNPQFHDKTLEAVPGPEDLQVIVGLPLCNDTYVLDPKEDTAILLSSGDLSLVKGGETFTSRMYCIDNGVTSDRNVTSFTILCFSDEAQQSRCFHLNYLPISLGISCAFLLATFVVYIGVAELRDSLSGRCLMSEVVSLFVAYITLLVLFSTPSIQDSPASCQFTGTLTHLSLLASFFWLNIMCFDVWKTLRSMKPREDRKEQTRRKFLMYSAYGWGSPLLIAIVGVVLDSLPDEPHYKGIIRPQIKTYCFFQQSDEKSYWIYLYGIILGLLVVNLGFFLHVMFILVRIHRQTKTLQNRGQSCSISGKKMNRDDQKKERERMWLYVKLFFVMGITWIAEIISWQTSKSFEYNCYFWLVFDVANSLRGLLIFIIFICKKSTLEKVKKEWFHQTKMLDVFTIARSQRHSMSKAELTLTTHFSEAEVKRKISAASNPGKSDIELKTFKH